MKKYLFLIPMLMAVFLLVSVSAQASFILRLDDGTTSLDIQDNDPNDSSLGVGVITFNGILSGASPWLVNVTTGLSKPVIGSVAFPEMDVNSVNVSSSAGGTLDIFLTDTDFGPLPGQNVSGIAFSQNIGGTTSGTVRTEAFADPGNGEFVQTYSLGSQFFNTSPFSGGISGSTPAFPDATSPFSLTQWATITHTGAGSTSFDYELKPVPEPATMLLSGLGLLGLGVYLRRRSKKA